MGVHADFKLNASGQQLFPGSTRRVCRVTRAAVHRFTLKRRLTAQAGGQSRACRWPKSWANQPDVAGAPHLVCLHGVFGRGRGGGGAAAPQAPAPGGHGAGRCGINPRRRRLK